MQRPDHRRYHALPAYRRAPWYALLLAAAFPAALYLLTHPLPTALLVGLLAGRLSARFVPRVRPTLFRVARRRIPRDWVTPTG